jgi:hypothetical protein
MRYTAAAVLGSVVVALTATGGVALVTSSGDEAPVALAPPNPSAPVVTKPVAPPKATVAPEVAQEMNGPRGRVTMADKIKMRAPASVDRHRLAGNGQGNGCVVGYGKVGQCLPLQSPAQVAMPDMDHPWTCPEVRELFPRGLAVAGKDTLGLDPDGDKVACGRGQ